MAAHGTGGGARTDAAFELRSGQFSLMLLSIRRLAANELQAALADHVAQAPALLQGAAVVLDLSQLDALPNFARLGDLIARIQSAGLRCLALAECDGIEPLAHSVGLPTLGVDRKRMRREPQSREPAQRDAPAREVAAPPAPRAPRPDPETAPLPLANSTAAAQPRVPTTAEAAVSQGPLVIPGPIRSGQQLYARGRDLIITGSVSAGAEVAADGCVHVYGRLSGKALAGASGDLRARVYCLSFGAELVSIAGNFKVFEAASREVAGKAVEIFLDDGRLDIRPLQV
jgi:septum site-determining protein MinC